MKKPLQLQYYFALVLNFLLLLSDLQIKAQQYDTIKSLKGFHRHNVINNFLRSASSKPEELKNLSEWIKQNGDKTDKEVFEIMMLLGDLELKKASNNKQLEAAESYLVAAKKNDNNFLIFYLYFNISEKYKTSHLFNKSIENSLYCLDELKKDPNRLYYNQTWALYQMGMDFYRYKDYKKAQELSTASYNNYISKNPHGDWFTEICSDLVGMTYLKDGKYDSAKKWLNITLNYAQKQKDPGWTGIALGNIATISYLQKKYSEAIPLFQLAISDCSNFNIWDNVSPFCTRLADCYIQTGNKAEASLLLTQAAAANTKDTTRTLSNLLEYYTIAADWHRIQGNAILALQYNDSANSYQQKIDDEFSILKKMEAEAKLNYRNKELENIVLKQEEKKGKWIRYGLIAALLIVASISFLLYKRQNLQHQLKKEKLEYEKLMAEEELHIAMIEIKDFTQNIREKNKLIEYFANEIDKLKSQNNSITDTQVSFIEDLKQSTILTDADWAKFKQIFEKAHPGFLTRLKTKYPDLTPAETRYLLFTKLGMLPKEMMSVLGVSAEAIRNVRFRIKKKLQLDDKKEIEDFINEV